MYGGCYLGEMPQQVGEYSPRCGQRLDDLCTLRVTDENIRRTEGDGTLRGECTGSRGSILRGVGFSSGHEDSSHLIHNRLAAYRATQACDVALLNARLRKVPAACKAAAAAVSAGQNSLHEVNARIFLHGKLTCYDIQQDRCDQSRES